MNQQEMQVNIDDPLEEHDEEEHHEEECDKYMILKPIFYNNIKGIWDYEGDEEERIKIYSILNRWVNQMYVEFRSYFLVHYSEEYFEKMEIIIKGVLHGEEFQLGFDIIQIVEGKYDEIDLEDPEYVEELNNLINNDYYNDQE